MTPVSLRPATAADAANLTRIAQAAYAKYVPRIGREPAPMLTDYAALVESAHVSLAELEAAPVGFLATIQMPDYLLLESIAVLPTMQSRGIGRLLLEQAELDAAQADCRQIRLYTNEAMTENLAYYAHHGYTETHRATVDGYHRVFFTKTLDAAVQP